MSSPFFIDPAVVQWVTANLDSIGASLASGHAAAAGPTTGVVAAAADEVSAAVAELFGGYGQQYQAVTTKAAAFHQAVHPAPWRPAGLRMPAPRRPMRQHCLESALSQPGCCGQWGFRAGNRASADR